jgi:hypothetical protein
MLFTPVFFIIFYVPHPLFAILNFIKIISNDAYEALKTTYIVLMSIIFTAVNSYAYYRVKKGKKDSQEKKEESSHLNKIFNT